MLILKPVKFSNLKRNFHHTCGCLNLAGIELTYLLRAYLSVGLNIAAIYQCIAYLKHKLVIMIAELYCKNK